MTYGKNGTFTYWLMKCHLNSLHCFQFDFHRNVFIQYCRGIVDLLNVVPYLAMTLIKEVQYCMSQ